jgi:hypothetical protein
MARFFVQCGTQKELPRLVSTTIKSRMENYNECKNNKYKFCNYLYLSM